MQKRSVTEQGAVAAKAHTDSERCEEWDGRV